MVIKGILYRLSITLFFIAYAFIINDLHAQNLQLSGGYNWSVALCSNGKIYAWGDNGRGQLGRNPSTGIKYAVASSTVPLEIQLPVGRSISKVDAGSGGTGIALACDGSVWTWGENLNGAIGNGLRGTCSPPPGADGNCYYSALQQVRGVGGVGFLNNVTYINASTNSSYAVEAGTGRVLAWGDNADGQLGQGNNTNTGNPYTPQYVLTSAGVPLTNIILVEGSDYGAYALSADGYVYSWGRNGGGNQELGRVSVPADQYYARRVKKYNYTTGTTTDDLDNIVKMSGGDTHGLAIDASGNLWSWGGDWGPGQRGWGATGSAVPYATRVVATGTACAYEQWKFGPWLTGAVEVSAGQQHSIVLMNDGRVVTFGSDGSGQLGNGAPGGSGCPVYVKTNATTDLTNIVAVSDGDLWSFAIDNAGTVYVWGENSTGELGISGNTTDQQFAVANPAIPTTCGGSLLPCPIADLGADVLKCRGIAHRLYAGANGDPYRYTWFSGPSATGPWTQIGAANQTYVGNGYYLDVTTPAFYRVQITDIRNPVSTACGPCPMSADVVQVTDRTPPLATSQAGTCGGTTVCFDINSTGAIDNNAFDWYANQVTATKLNTSGTTNPFCTAASNLTLNGSNYEIWVEDRRVFQSTVGPTTVPCPPAPSGGSGGGNIDQYQQQFVIYRDVTITSVQVYYRTYSTSATPDQVRVTVYNNDPNKNSTGNDGVNPAATGITSTTIAVPRTSTNFQLITLSGLNLPLTGSAGGTKYWLEISAVGGSNGAYASYTCAAGYPYSDAVVGEDVVVLRGSTASQQVIQQANYNAIAFNWNFTYQSGYPCGRFILTAPSGTTACLPVEFLYFRGENKGNFNALSWGTGSEQNSDYFEIQKSYDGSTWQSIGKVKAAGNSSQLLEYHFDDKAVRKGITYYRIKEHDINGEVNYSKTISLNSEATNQIAIIPNPNNGTFTIQTSGLFHGKTTIYIYDALSRLVYDENENFSENLSQKDISTPLGTGVYFVVISDGNNIHTQKMIIK